MDPKQNAFDRVGAWLEYIDKYGKSIASITSSSGVAVGLFAQQNIVGIVVGSCLFLAGLFIFAYAFLSQRAGNQAKEVSGSQPEAHNRLSLIKGSLPYTGNEAPPGQVRRTVAQKLAEKITNDNFRVGTLAGPASCGKTSLLSTYLIGDLTAKLSASSSTILVDCARVAAEASWKERPADKSFMAWIRELIQEKIQSRIQDARETAPAVPVIVLLDHVERFFEINSTDAAEMRTFGIFLAGLTVVVKASRVKVLCSVQMNSLRWMHELAQKGTLPTSKECMESLDYLRPGEAVEILQAMLPDLPGDKAKWLVEDLKEKNQIQPVELQLLADYIARSDSKVLKAFSLKRYIEQDLHGRLNAYDVGKLVSERKSIAIAVLQHLCRARGAHGGNGIPWESCQTINAALRNPPETAAIVHEILTDFLPSHFVISNPVNGETCYALTHRCLVKHVEPALQGGGDKSRGQELLQAYLYTCRNRRWPVIPFTHQRQMAEELAEGRHSEFEESNLLQRARRTSLAGILAVGVLLVGLTYMIASAVAISQLERNQFNVANGEFVLSIHREYDTPAEMANFLRSRLALLKDASLVLPVRNLVIQLDSSWADLPCPDISATRDPKAKYEPALESLSKFTSLEKLNLSGLNVSGISEALEKLRDLKELNLKQTRVAEIPDLKTFPRLTMLDLWRCPISKIDGLTSAKNLKYLDVSETYISSLEDLSGLVHMDTLKGFNTAISELRGLPNLKELKCIDFHQTRLTHVQGLGGLTHLRHVNLSRTPISELEDLKDLDKLEELIIGFTRVQSIFGLTSKVLIRLDLSGLSNLTHLRNLSELPKLRLLDISRSGITELPGLENLSDLCVLNVWKTNIENLNGLDRLANMEALEISDTPKLKSLPSLTNLRRLSSLRASKTVMIDLPPFVDSEFPSSNLRELVLNHATTQRIPSLQFFPHLELLDISNTPIQMLTELKECSRLRELIVADSDITYFAGLRYAKRLAKLDVSGTQITSLVEDIKNLPILGEVGALNCSRLEPELRQFSQDHPHILVILNPEAPKSAMVK